MLLVKEFFQKDDDFKLKQLANETIKPSVLYNDKILVKIPLIAYSLSKLLSKDYIVSSDSWSEAKKSLINSIEKSVVFLKKKDEKSFKKSLNSVSDELRKVDFETGRFMQSVFDKAKMKYASTAYYFGMSLSQAAFLTGADKIHLQNYIGKTRQHEDEIDFSGIKKRLYNLKQVVNE